MVAATEEMTVLGPWAESLQRDWEDARLLGKEAEQRARFIIERECEERQITHNELYAILSGNNA